MPFTQQMVESVKKDLQYTCERLESCQKEIKYLQKRNAQLVEKEDKQRDEIE